MVKLCVFSLPGAPAGKQSVKDSRLDEVDALTKSKKKTYLQVELVSEEAVRDADVVIASIGSRADLVLGDLEFVETRLSRAEGDAEKTLLEKLKQLLEKESLLFQETFTPEEKKLLSGYGLLTLRPVVFVEAWDPQETSVILQRALREGGYRCFITTGEKETRAWLIKSGVNAREAAGEIHSDIQRGFIRAEVIGIEDFLSCGGESRAKQAGKMRLEPAEYVVQDGDVLMFRFNR